jgi:hypothetical protein
MPSALRTALALLLLAPTALASQAVSAPSHAALPRAQQRAIDALFKEYDKPFVPGCALGVMRNGALHLSVHDALRWDENFYHPRVGGSEMVRQLQARGTLANGDSINYARGLEIDHYRGLRRVQHGGDWVGYHAEYSRFPDQHTSVIILCNSDGISPTELADRVADVVLAKSFTESAQQVAAAGSDGAASRPSSSPLATARLVGSYYAASTDEVARMVEKDSSLVLELVGRSLPLKPSGPVTYAVSGIPVTVEFVADGSAPARAIRIRVASELRAEAVRFTTPAAGPLPVFGIPL